MTAPRAAIVALSFVLVLAVGCGLDDAYAEDRQETSDDSARSAPGDGNRRLASEAEAALESFAAVWIEWISNDSPETRAKLIALSAGSLQEELLMDGRRGAPTVPGSRTFRQVEGVLREHGAAR